MPKSSSYKCLLGCIDFTKLHRINPHKRKQWLSLVNMEHCKTQRIFLCNRHFSRDMYSRTLLQKDAFPNLNLGKTKHLMTSDEDEDDDDDDEMMDMMLDATEEEQKISNSSKSGKVASDNDDDGRLSDEGIFKFIDDLVNDNYCHVSYDIHRINDHTFIKKERDSPTYIDEEIRDGIAIINMKSEESSSSVTRYTQTRIPDRHPCALVHIAPDNCSYILSCFKCPVEFPLSSWHKLVLHLMKNHPTSYQETIEDEITGVADTIKQETMEENKNSLQQLLNKNVTRIVPKKEPGFNDDASAGSDDDDDDIPTNNNIIDHFTIDDDDFANDYFDLDDNEFAGKNSNMHISDMDEEEAVPEIDEDFLRIDFEEFSDLKMVYDDDDDGERKKSKSINKVSRPKDVITFLEAVKKCSELWLPKSRGKGVHNKAVERLLNILNIKADFKMSYETAMNALHGIFEWYRKASTQYKQTECFPYAFDAVRHKYYNMITEIIRLGKNLSFKCNGCSNYYLDNRTLKSHKTSCLPTIKTKKSIGFKPSIHTCEFCGIQCETEKQLESHQNAHHHDDPDDNQFFSLLQEEGKSAERMPEGSQLAINERISNEHWCKYCGVSCGSAYHLEMHEMTHKPKEATTNTKCKFCGLLCKTARNLMFHEKTHSLKPSTITSQDYNKSDISGHSTITGADHHHQLENRNTSTKPASSIAKKLQCNMCDKSFVTVTQYKMHIRTHSKIKNIICNICGKEFYDPLFLYNHKVRFHGEHGFQCPHHGCNIVCRTKERLQGHLSRKHSTKATATKKQKNPKVKPFHVCYECGKIFLVSKIELQDHYRSTGHQKNFPGPIDCVVCNRTFTQPRGYRRHLIKIHADLVCETEMDFDEFINCPETSPLHCSDYTESEDDFWKQSAIETEEKKRRAYDENMIEEEIKEFEGYTEYMKEIEFQEEDLIK